MARYFEYIDQHKERFEQELFDLLRIPSISAVSSNKGDVRQAAEFIREQFDQMGLNGVQLFETPGNPVVYGEYMDAGRDKPTVLVYGHYDVQPPDPLELWETEPFEPTVRNGDVYARGASDDK